MAPEAKQDYIWGIDLVRLYAATIVAVFHLSWKQLHPQVTLDSGWVGVEIFFVISGYVIIGTARRFDPVTFGKRRFSRLYPCALVCAAFDFLFVRMGDYYGLFHGIGVKPTLMALFHSIVLVKGPYLVSALWTLPIELAFYAVIFVLILFRQGHRFGLLAALLVGWSALYLIPHTAHAVGLSAVALPNFGYGPGNMTLLRHGALFAVGIVIWQLAHDAVTPGRLAVLGAGIAVSSLEIVGRAFELRSSYFYPPAAVGLAAEALAMFLAALALIGLAVAFNHRVRLGGRAAGLVRVIGLMTYPMYLVHEAVGGFLLGLFQAAGEPHAVALAVAIAAALVASWMIVRILEPLARWPMDRAMNAIVDRSLERLKAARSAG